MQEKSQNVLAAPSGQTENDDKRKVENRIFIEQLFYLAEQSKLSLEDIMNESQSMVVVSFETVSTCIMNALLCLALNQDCLEKLRLEIHEVFATENSNIPKSDHKTMDLHVGTNHLLNMPYLDMVLNESLRLVTTVPMNMRDVSSQFKLKMLDPKAQHVARIHERKTACHNKIVTVPKGTIIAVDTFNMQRNADYWGPNALEFCPERFSKEGVQDITNHTGRWHSYAYIPFSKGLRTCIGQRYSIYLSKIFLIRLISCYEFTTNVQFKDLQYYEGISLKYRNAKDISFEIHRVNQSHQ
ncbi:probable cytochrome P450 318a1 [Stomoxys calcitrans]|uniref:probable cytochrome P450 318a1 n=1 Tax=Stomoxys calcitrans TaxID=35570 RepID=UPI0027E39FE8|nr:probable cytochrome P450 318a1 [Stomoxys calcitrans]